MRRTLRALVIVVLGVGAAVSAQPRPGGWGRPALPYDGQLTFVRLRWGAGAYGVPVLGGINYWIHEFPRAEQNLMGVLDEFTLVDARTDGSLVLMLDDPQLFTHPVVMMWEPGYWAMTDEQASRLRDYIRKGGFVIFNDFELDGWNNFEAQMRRVIPEGRWLPLDAGHPIFSSFFRIAQPDYPHPRGHHLFGFQPEYFGLFEQNDPAGRMMAIANYNTNLAEYWQMAGTGFFPIDASNVGFQLGINYMMYGLTH